MCSRETTRLPIAELHRKLQSHVPNIENGRAASQPPSDPRYFVYHGQDWEFGIKGFGAYRFVLVEVTGLQEKVLEQGRADPITLMMGDKPLTKFDGLGGQVGHFRYYCDNPEVR